jgi:hypothetical protein
MGKPKNFGWDSKEEMLTNRRNQDNKQKKIAYWRKKYDFDVSKEDYDLFIKNIPIIKKVYDNLEKYLAYEKDVPMSISDFDFYANNYDKLKLVNDNREYLSSLKRIVIQKKETPIIITF